MHELDAADWPIGIHFDVIFLECYVCHVMAKAVIEIEFYGQPKYRENTVAIMLWDAVMLWHASTLIPLCFCTVVVVGRRLCIAVLHAVCTIEIGRYDHIHSSCQQHAR